MSRLLTMLNTLPDDLQYMILENLELDEILKICSNDLFKDKEKCKTSSRIYTNALNILFKTNQESYTDKNFPIKSLKGLLDTDKISMPTLEFLIDNFPNRLRSRKITILKAVNRYSKKFPKDIVTVENIINKIIQKKIIHEPDSFKSFLVWAYLLDNLGMVKGLAKNYTENTFPYDDMEEAVSNSRYNIVNFLLTKFPKGIKTHGWDFYKKAEAKEDFDMIDLLISLDSQLLRRALETYIENEMNKSKIYEHLIEKYISQNNYEDLFIKVLLYAASIGDLETFKKLDQYKKVANARRRALDKAYMTNNFNIVQYLLDTGENNIDVREDIEKKYKEWRAKR